MRGRAQKWREVGEMRAADREWSVGKKMKNGEMGGRAQK